MKSKITKGPWVRFDGSILPGSGGPLIAQVELIDDARLIASAPDLNKALNMVNDKLMASTTWSVTFTLKEVAQIREAIAKAEGK